MMPQISGLSNGEKTTKLMNSTDFRSGIGIKANFFLWGGLSHIYPKNMLTAPEKLLR